MRRKKQFGRGLTRMNTDKSFLFNRRSSAFLCGYFHHVLKCSNLFNTLDARGAISVTERVGVIGRIRKLAVEVAEEWLEQAA